MEKQRLPDTPFWVEPDRIVEDHLRLSAEESHHLLRVFRATPGTPFQATDGQGAFFECVLESVERRSAVGRIVERREGWGELPRSIHLLVGLPEWRAVEQVVEHAVPLGASAIDFVVCDRSGREVLGAQRIARLERIARAALKQSRRSRLPILSSSPSLAGAVRALNPGERYYGDPAGRPFSRSSTESPQTPLQLAVGPSGGFTEEERRFLTEAGFSPISLGPSRLTTETASLALISLARNSL